MTTLDVKIVVTEDELCDLLITAVEGGIDYWAHVRNYRPSEGTVEFREQGPVDVYPWRKATWRDMAVGLEICAESYPRVFASWLADRIGDAASCDVIFQCAMLGSEVYG